MKKILLLSLGLVLLNVSKAQNPYKSLGIKNVKVLTLSNGKYNEFFNNDTFVRIGSVMLNTKSNKIVSFIDKDSIEHKTGYEPQLVSRWVSPDPLAEKYYEWSPYNYVADNPIIYIDPDGQKIVLAGTAAQQQTSLQHLQKLTNDKLGINSSGEMIIARMGGENAGTYLKAGNALIRDLNQKGAGAKTMTISIGTSGSGNYEQDVNSTNAINGTGTDVTVNFDPTANPSIPTKDPVTGNVTGATRPDEIGLAHEMIHGERSMDGKATNYSTTDTHTYKDAAGNTVTQTAPKEELQTVGLKGNNPHDITENKIRKEQGLKERGAY